MTFSIGPLNLRQRGQAASTKAKARMTQLSSWKLPKQSSSIAPPGIWTNADQDPVPPEKRTWTGTTFILFWFSDLITVGGWSAASSIVATGLSATDAILITLVAALCNAIPTVLNGAIGADLHIPFPIAARASYGYWLSYFCVISRGILALFWFGIQGAFGASCITPIITAIWPSYTNIPNYLPASAGITTQGMVSYFLYNLIQFPCLLIPTHRLQLMFWIKSVLVPPTALAMVIWISVTAGGGGNFFNEPATVQGSQRAWLWLSSLTSMTGGFSTLAVNIPDFSRFNKTPGAQVWQFPFIPIFKVLVALLGIVSASASQQLYGQTLWSPIDIINQWQGSPGGRAAAFFCALVWLLAQICVNISSNSISFANDLASLVPKYFNIRRGVIFAAFIGGWALCPWIITSSAITFLLFMSAYAVFMGPIAGIMVCDYWLVKRRKYHVPDLYNPAGIYHYDNWGINWRALVVNVVVIAPLLPGLADKVTPNTVSVSEGFRQLYSFNWLFGFFSSVTLYFGLNHFFPDRSTLIPHVVRDAQYHSPQTEGEADSQAESGILKTG